MNTGAGETRLSLSWNGERLLLGLVPSPEGMSDVYLSTRLKVAAAG